MATFFEMKAGRSIINKQLAAAFFTIYLVINIQILIASVLAIDFSSPLATTGYIMLIPLLPAFLVIHFVSKKENMAILEFLNYALNLRRF